MIPTTELKKGLKIELEGKPYVILQSTHTNPGKGSAFVRARIKNLETGAVIERTFKAGVDTGLERPELDERQMSYMYSDMEGFNFMCQNTYETIHLTKEQIGDDIGFLQEGIMVAVIFYKGRPISIDLPNFVNIRVTSAEPGVKGDTATGASKKATLETGMIINVPLFVKDNDLLKIDTRTGEYVERVKE
ncbi:MAG: elongation factor P [Bdellovibrionales bacterium RIFOXYD12_FULL_39_22]|nr:MAG: elongation factor P [Bdellovibrionales bacterium RIFOXYB1_FULL_39_21]OFZ45156.1 MAG: elongation factor P [Bdellovibrionales bacterium RIFOXYC12_FULL_39_17]OFZ45652.1 MAG: elongation factor P [Bdellovibrionales bacterium RIFOXYC1_FULL_39_130]OFZ73834.1 MAG: elongation factor P [Bdellovibrionales bacterium RIFOXYC2_FULL_39_8]OFZ77514.1 MAG: elongation factor P [Bdellovibrionales bacterium RIFOXYD1_FULL_39_84]OFZ91643.1 MAG: elongation factor P [Bdellovibrionales bacterium RIFOXYD12_FULL_